MKIANVLEIVCLKDCFKPFTKILSFNSLITMRWVLILSHSLDELAQGLCSIQELGFKDSLSRNRPLTTAPGCLTAQNLGGKGRDDTFRVSLGS